MAYKSSVGSAPKVIRRAVSIARPRLPLLLGLAGLIFVPLSLLGTLGESLGELEGNEGVALGAAAVAAASILAATSLLGQLLFAGLIAASVTRSEAGEPPLIATVVREARWRTLIAIDLLTTVAVIAGLLLLILPGILLFGRYALASTVSDVQRCGVRESFRRSARLSRGHRTLIVTLLLGALLAGEGLEAGLGALIAGQGFLSEWLATSFSQIIAKPVFAVLAVGLVLELSAAPPPSPELD